MKSNLFSSLIMSGLALALPFVWLSILSRIAKPLMHGELRQ